MGQCTSSPIENQNANANPQRNNSTVRRRRQYADDDFYNKVPSTPPPAYSAEDPAATFPPEPSAPPQYLVETQGNTTAIAPSENAIRHRENMERYERATYVHQMTTMNANNFRRHSVTDDCNCSDGDKQCCLLCCLCLCEVAAEIARD